MISLRPPNDAPLDRRRDRRLTMTGQTVLRTLHGQVEMHGGVVDVSAGGLRVRLRPGDLPAVGDLGAVDLRVVPGGGREGAAAVRMTGFAEVVRVDRDGTGSADVAVRFLDPLRVRDAFEPAPAIAAWS